MYFWARGEERSGYETTSLLISIYHTQKGSLVEDDHVRKWYLSQSRRKTKAAKDDNDHKSRCEGKAQRAIIRCIRHDRHSKKQQKRGKEIQIRKENPITRFRQTRHPHQETSITKQNPTPFPFRTHPLLPKKDKKIPNPTLSLSIPRMQFQFQSQLLIWSCLSKQCHPRASNQQRKT
jgi:hypothetical protein